MPAPVDPAPATLTNRQLWGRLLTRAWSHRRACVTVILLQTALLALGLLGLNFIGTGIDYLRGRLHPGVAPPRWLFGLAPPAAWSPLTVLCALGGAILLAALLRAVLNFFYALAAARLIHGRILLELRLELYAKLQRLSFRFFDRHGSGALINRVISDVQAMRLFVEGVLIQGFIVVLSLVVYLVYMVSLSPRLTVVCLATTPLLWALSVGFSRRVRPLYLAHRDLLDRMVLLLSESIQGAHTVKGFAREAEMRGRFAEANGRVRDQQEAIFRRVSRFSPAIGFVSQFNIFLLLTYGGLLVIHGRLPLGAGLIVFTSLLQQFAAQVSKIADIANSAQQGLTSARRIFEILDAPVEIASPALPMRPGRLRGTIEFDHVTFGYNDAQPVLHDVSFRVEPGQCVALVGVTGSGKSTLLSLIPRFYDPQGGAVRIDGRDVRTFELPALRRQIGLVFQESFLFSDSVGANIAFGQPQASREQAERAAVIAAADEFIVGLPQGYDTLLGEMGVDLSGGQRQRLAIARAVLLEPPILLMDDPTAAIDPATEHEILSAMERAIAGRTTFIVAHRLSTLQRADFIIVLDRGRVVQTGSHDELLRSRGPYRRAARLQLADLPPLPAA